MSEERRQRHSSSGRTDGRVFLPQSRMRQIRREEAVYRAILKREGVKDPVFIHISCHCGSMGCQGLPHLVPLVPAPTAPAKKPKGPSDRARLNDWLRNT